MNEKLNSTDFLEYNNHNNIQQNMLEPQAPDETRTKGNFDSEI
jgi:hypothetical protein